MARVLTEKQGIWLGVAAWLAAAATSVACGGKQIDVGNDQPMASAGSLAMGGATGAGASGGAPPGISAEELAQIQWPPEETCEAAPGSKLVGTWKGHWPETLGNPSDVVITVSGLTADGVPCGTVTIGAGPPPPPVTDTEAIYPTTPSSGAGGRPGGPGPVFGDVWPGYAYRMLHVQSFATRFEFGITYNQVMRPWCQLQPAYQDTSTCLPAWTNGSQIAEQCTISGPKLPTTEVPCSRFLFCNTAVCFCYDGHCDASAAAQMPFVAHWDGPGLEVIVLDQTLFLDPVAP